MSISRLEVEFKVHYMGVMGDSLTIGQIAKAAGVPTSTVRYYERAGLLRPTGRTAANYRVYSAGDLERLRFIRAAQATGFQLEDVKKLLRPAPCGQVQELIEERLGQVAKRMKELTRVRRVLRESLDTCQAHAASGRCRVVDQLTATALRKP